MSDHDPRWDEVRRLRKEAEDHARKDDMLAASMLDGQASQLAAQILAAEVKP